MNVLSKISTKLALPGNRITEPHLELGYNTCDNPDCKYPNSLQAAKGRYNCKGFLPKPKLAAGIGSRFKSELPRWRRGAAGDESNESDSDDDFVRRERCPGTYRVSAEQAYYASHLFHAAKTERCRRADLKRDKAARRAAREARSRAVKLAKEVQRESKREFVLREKQRVRTGGEGQNTDEIEIQQPVKRLKREIRRLPVTIRTSVPSTADPPPSSSPPASPQPAFRRLRNVSDAPPRPRPVAICFDEFSLTSPLPPAVPQPASASRAQYPLVSRPVFSARNRSASMSDVNDRATGRTQQEQDSPFRLRRAVTYVQARRVSYKNGFMITHFGTLVPPNRVCVSPLLNGGRSPRR